MTLSTTLDRQYFDANGVNVNFPFNFKFLDNSQIFVWTIAPDGTPTAKVLTTDYTLAGVGVETGGTVTFLVAPPLTVPATRVFIQRIVASTQPTSIRNQGKFFPELHENVFDRLTMLIQQAGAATANSLQLDLSGLFWNFLGHRGINAADPINPQDVTTKAWVSNFVEGFTGLINTTVGILYDGGTLFDYLRFGVGRNVDSIAALKLLAGTRNQRAFVLGYYAKGDGGGGVYYVDPTDTTSLDNGGTIIVAADGARWKLAETSVLSIKQFGAKGDGVANDTTPIQNAANWLGLTGKLYAPKGVYNFTLLNFDSAVGFTIEGDGAIGTTIFRCTSVTATDGIKFRSTFDCTLSLITVDHSSASFTGWLIDTRHKPASSTDTQGFYMDRCTLASQGYNKYSAKGLNLDQTTLVTIEGCKFVSLLRPIDGQNSAGGGYSNGIRILNSQFFDNVGYAVNFLGEQWTLQDNNFQACHDGAQRIAFSDNTTNFKSLLFMNNGVYDALAAGTSYLQLGTGQGLGLINGMWGGRSDLGSSTFLNATGAITGVSCQTVRFSLFTNVFVASAGQLAWDLEGGNTYVSCANVINGASNVTGLTLDLNSPNASQGTLPGTSGTASIRYNHDGSIEMTGAQASIAAGGNVGISFGTAFPTACWDVQVTLQAPAATSNTISISGAPSNTGFTVFINGTGNSTVRWRAVGK